jgi:hypothetical protein
MQILILIRKNYNLGFRVLGFTIISQLSVAPNRFNALSGVNRFYELAYRIRPPPWPRR